MAQVDRADRRRAAGAHPARTAVRVGRSRATAPTPSIADPLWMIGRQWQLGELLGEDVGNPVSVRVERRALPITAWMPTGDTDDAGLVAGWRPWPEGAVLDELVEHVPPAGQRARPAVAGRVRRPARRHARATAGHDDAADRCSPAHPLTPGRRPGRPRGRARPGARGAARRAGRCRARRWRWRARRWRPATRPGSPGPPTPAGRAPSPPSGWRWAAGSPLAGGAWTTTRLEHRFRLRFGHGDDAVVVDGHRPSAPGSARWHHFEWRPGDDVDLDGDADWPAPETDGRRDAGGAAALPGHAGRSLLAARGLRDRHLGHRGPAPRPGPHLPGRVRAGQRRRLADRAGRRPSRRASTRSSGSPSRRRSASSSTSTRRATGASAGLPDVRGDQRARTARCAASCCRLWPPAR